MTSLMTPNHAFRSRDPLDWWRFFAQWGERLRIEPYAQVTADYAAVGLCLDDAIRAEAPRVYTLDTFLKGDFNIAALENGISIENSVPEDILAALCFLPPLQKTQWLTQNPREISPAANASFSEGMLEIEQCVDNFSRDASRRIPAHLLQGLEGLTFSNGLKTEFLHHAVITSWDMEKLHDPSAAVGIWAKMLATQPKRLLSSIKEFPDMPLRKLAEWTDLLRHEQPSTLELRTVWDSWCNSRGINTATYHWAWELHVPLVDIVQQSFESRAPVLSNTDFTALPETTLSF